MPLKRRVPGKEVSRETLILTPGKAYQFLMGVNQLTSVREDLAERGMTEAERGRGWDLLRIVGMTPRNLRVTDLEVRRAINAIDKWDEEAFVCMDSAFTNHPEAYESVLGGLSPVVGDRAVINADTVLRRLDELEKTKEGRAALKTLAERGVTADDRKRIAGLIEVARAKGKGAPDKAAADADAAYEEALLDLRDWYTQWSSMARLLVSRRDYLISLGLATRRAGENEPDFVDPTEDPAVDPTEDPTEEPTDPNKPRM